MRAPVTVVTATIPGREKLLGECLASVYAQSVEPMCHMVMAQSITEQMYPPSHVAIQQNMLLEAVQTPWVMRLADDDMILPHHIETLLPYIESDDWDVIYSWDALNNRPRTNCNDWSQVELIEYLKKQNLMDGSAVMTRMDNVMEAGGWPVAIEAWGEKSVHFPGESMAVCEDWALFYKLAVAGARFKCVPEPTWCYRIGTWPRISSCGWYYKGGKWSREPIRF